jgi:hypothetical protein
MVSTALTIAVSKGTDSGIEDEVAPATTHFPPPRRGRRLRARRALDEATSHSVMSCSVSPKSY